MEDLAPISGIMLFLLLGGLGYALAVAGRWGPEKSFQGRLFLLAFVVRFAFSFVIYGFGLIKLLKDEDGSGWVIGIAYQQQWESLGYGIFDLPTIIVEMFTQHHKGYYYLLAFLFSVVEHGRLPAAALNCFFGSIMIVYAYRLATNLFNVEAARRVGYWLCFFPSMIIWSAQTIKEPVVILLEVLLVYGCVQIRRSGLSTFHLLMTLCCIIALIPFRFYAAYLGVVAVAAALVFPAVGSGRVKLGPIVAGMFLLFFLISTGILAGQDSVVERMNLDALTKMKKYAANGGEGFGSSVAMDYDLTTSSGFGLSMLIGAAHLLLAPFPWQLASGSARMILVGPEMLFWWWLVYAGFLPGLMSIIRHDLNKNLPLLLMLVGFGLLYSLTFYNVGLVYRQRAQLLPWLLIIASVGIEQRKICRELRSKKRRAGSRDERAETPAEAAFGPPSHPAGHERFDLALELGYQQEYLSGTTRAHDPRLDPRSNGCSLKRSGDRPQLD